MLRGLRHQLFSILLLGVLTSALSIFALSYLVRTFTAQRIERARDAVTEEADRISKHPDALGELPASTLLGMRGGTQSPGEELGAMPAEWRTKIAEALAKNAGATAAESEFVLEGGTLVIASRRSEARPGKVAWAATLVRPAPFLRTWQTIVVLLAVGTILLVAVTLTTVVSMNRGANSLRAVLRELPRNLGAEVPRPRVRELEGIADGISRLAEDLSAAREAEARMARELADKERLAALGRVAAGVAHEVRNPLASIKLRLDLARSSGGIPPVAEQAILHATSEIARLDRLVADLLMVAGRPHGPRREMDLGDLLRSRVAALAPWTDARSVSIDVTGDAAATIDSDAVGRAVDNLLRNAVEASPAGSPVRAEVRKESSHVVLSVVDRGEGVPEKRLDELFEPFFTTKPEGTGLGLALSRSIARAHGGDVFYRREEGATLFEIHLACGASSVPAEAAE